MGNARNIAFWVVLFLMILALFNAFGGNSAQMNSTQIAYSDFIQRVENDQVTAATIDGETVIVTGTDGRRYSTVRPVGEDLALLGTNFGQASTPAWALNLEADPRAVGH